MDSGTVNTVYLEMTDSDFIYVSHRVQTVLESGFLAMKEDDLLILHPAHKALIGCQWAQQQ